MAALTDQRHLWDLKAIQLYAGWSPEVASAHIAAEPFPKPVQIPGLRSMWFAEEVRAYVASGPEEPDLSSDHVLYRFFDRDDRLLYVGISFSTLNRLQKHKHTAKWFRRIYTIKLERFSSRAEVRKAEKLAILEERPLFNRHS